MDNCIIRINETMDTLSKQEQKVANYVLKHTFETAEMTVAELSKKCKCSTATIMRFCYALKYDGYRDFIKALYSDVANNLKSEERIYDIDNDDISHMSVSSTIYTVCKLNIESLNNTLKILNADEIDKAINLIDKANKVAIFSLSGSAVVGDDAMFKFQRLAINSQAYKDSHSQILAASIMNSKDVAVIISYSGETTELIEVANMLKERNVPIICVSKYGDNPLSKISSINLHHASIGKGLKTYSTRSRIVQQNIIDILFVGLSQIRKDKLKLYYKLFSK